MVNRWVEHVRQYAKDNNLTYACAIPYAKESYIKKDGTKSIQSKSLPPPKPEPKAEQKAKPKAEPKAKPKAAPKANTTDKDAYELLFKTLDIKAKNIQRDIIFDINDLIKRYGDDGYGDKPESMNRITYWAQHLDLTKYMK